MRSQQLLVAVSLERVVFVVDDSTDQTFLERALKDAWQHGAHAQPRALTR